LNQQFADEDRTKLEAKMATVLGDKIKELSVELQKILLDDMVTAFENRFLVFERAKLAFQKKGLKR
jgi:hypothetical protein